MENLTSTLTPIDFKVDLNTPPHQFGCRQLEKGCENQITSDVEISENDLCATFNADRQLEKTCEKELYQITKDVEFSKIEMRVDVDAGRQLKTPCEKELYQTEGVEFSKIEMCVDVDADQKLEKSCEEELYQITSNVDDSSIKQPTTILSVSFTSFFMRILFSFRL